MAVPARMRQGPWTDRAAAPRGRRRHPAADGRAAHGGNAARRVRIVAAVAVVGVVALAGCDGGGSGRSATPAPGRTLGVAPSPALSPSPSPSPAVAVDQVPPVERIDVAYVQAVVDAIDARVGELADRVKQTGELDEQGLAVLHALFADQAREVNVAEWRSYFPPRLADDPGPPRTKVLELRTVSPTCVSFTADRDLAPLVPGAVFPQPFSMAIRPAERDLPDNPTAWVIVQDGTDAEGEGRLLADPCTE